MHAITKELDRLRREHTEVKYEFAAIKFELALRRCLRKYNPDQPRVPAGNPGGGRWTSGEGGALSDENVDVSGARRKSPLVAEFGQWAARQFISAYCQAKINREFPGEFEDKTIAEIEERARRGDARARRCLKLLRDPRFRK